MFSKGASIVGPITALGPIWLVYYLASSEVPTPVVVEEKVENKTENNAEEKQESKEEEKVEETQIQKKEPEKSENNGTLTKEVLKITSSVLDLLKNVISLKS